MCNLKEKEFVIAAVAYVKVNIYLCILMCKFPNVNNVENADNVIIVKYAVD